jgi:cobaltochelatase CobS
MEVNVDSNKKLYLVAPTFNIPAPANLMIVGNQETGPFVPTLDPSYVFRKEMLRDVLAWLADSSGEGLYLFGPTGCGKSSLICQVAARLNLPVERVNAHSRLELAELTGHFLLTGGSMHFIHGPLSIALRDGYLFLLDELDLLDPATLAGLNTVLDGSSLSIPETGEVIVPHPEFRFVATGNTSGAGDRTGLYQGALRQNLAFMDRFWVVAVSYPDPELENEVLSRSAPLLPEILRRRMVEVANEVRRLFLGESEEASAIEVTMSTRVLVRWARLAIRFSGAPLAYALDRALTFRAEPATREAIRQIVQRHLGDEAAVLKG